MDNNCIFCSGNLHPIYQMDEYTILQCKKCKTALASPMPTQEQLHVYYSGFSFQSNINNLSYFKDIKFKNWLSGLQIKENSSMLDVGGGGGFFSYAFEYFNFGKATYIDLDDKACEFAKTKIGISDVVCGDATQLCVNSSKKYDFIYARHLIEHLTNPLFFVDSLLALLKNDGVLMLHFPNGNSLEYLAYPYALQNRRKCIMESNKNLNYLTLLSRIFKQQISHGMYPPRHLWALTKKGFKQYFKNRNSDFEIEFIFARMDDPIYSPYFKIDSLGKRIKTLTIARLFAMINGGSHLIVKITKKKV